MMNGLPVVLNGVCSVPFFCAESSKARGAIFIDSQ